jgi:RNA polymerase sigma factor (TIGR02999 family)
VPEPPQSVTNLLIAWGNGNRDALDKLIPIVHDELRRQASRCLRRERPGHTLETTDLIDEAYLRLVAQKSLHLHNRTQFFAIAARLMRQILVDHARAKRRLKRGGADLRVTLTGARAIANDRDVDLIAIDEPLNRLAKIDQQQSRIVELRFFSGLNVEETAEALDISPATVKRDWRLAKGWLHRELSRR